MDVLKMLVEQGADIYVTTKERLGALHVCAMWGTETMLRYLLEKNLDSSRPGVIHINQNGHFL